MAVNLDWLATEGGKMLVLVGVLFVILGIMVLLVLTGHPPSDVAKELANTAVTSLLTILYQYLAHK